MTYRIEITAETLSELAGKTLALAAQFQVTAADPVMPEVKAATRKAKSVKVEEPEVAEQAPADPTPSEAASSGPTEASPTAPSGTEPETPTTGEPEAPAAPEVDPTYLRDLVLTVVEKRGKPFMSEILERFGIAKASQVAPEHAAELVATMLEALGK